MFNHSYRSLHTLCYFPSYPLLPYPSTYTMTTTPTYPLIYVYRALKNTWSLVFILLLQTLKMKTLGMSKTVRMPGIPSKVRHYRSYMPYPSLYSPLPSTYYLSLSTPILLITHMQVSSCSSGAIKVSYPVVGIQQQGGIRGQVGEGYCIIGRD